ncbi:vegetative cell wall protein gp1-like [Colias croceus]|uniref:vegetative cell wall protein gp1-like n=1 Tax=Colias crocea TaxID=72248 RepID=UPI001E27F659|nr:vegetative cell wall protein gp1-like [Colias croceus]
MRKVIFLCLLSLSLCLGKPADNQGAPGVPSPPPAPLPSQPPVPVSSNVPVDPNAAKITAPIPVPIIVPVPGPTPNPNPQVKSEQAASPAAQAPAKPVDPAPAKPVAPAPVPTTDNNITTEKKVEIPPQGKPQEAPANKTEEVPKTPIPVPTEKPSEPTKPTVAPKDDAAVHPIEARSGFDGPSFIGGIILTLGLLAIGFMGFKYYKNQTERNYHTL